MVRRHFGGRRLAAACLAALTLALLHPATPGGVSSDIVISQVYGGGGNSGATYRNDFVELFNRGDAPVTITGWTVQYASATGTTWQTTALSGTIPAGGYYLVQQAQGAGGTVSLPPPDATGTIAMSATAGKVALVNTATALTGGCPSGGIVDFVGFGSTASCFEAAPTATLSNTVAALRADSGCLDTDNNSTDFATAAPSPRNSASPASTCDGPPSVSISDVSVTEGNAGTTTASFTVSLSAPAPAGGVSFDIATADDSATQADNDYVPASLTAQVIPAGSTTYAFAVSVNGDMAVEADEGFFVTLTNVVGAAVADGQGRGTIVNDDLVVAVRDVVISQVYGGGGNSGAPLANDFVELFNRESTAVSLAGWSVQYASSAGTTWSLASLSGTIAPGGYYLVRLAGGATGGALPAADATGTLNLSSSTGKVALVAGADPLTGACPASLNIADFVGFGSSASCFEGSGSTSNLSNTTAAHRRRFGCLDSDDNRIDFSVAAPAPRNSASATVSCELIFTAAAIHAIQGSGAASPFAGQDVTTTGIVTARKNNGFFLQTADDSGDGDPNTSQALFVFTGTTPLVAAGDLATVKGTATEFFGLTQIESTLPGDVAVASAGNPVPAPVALTQGLLDPQGTTTQLERLEGMLVQAAAVTSVAPTNEFAEIYAVLNGVARPMREPGIEAGRPLPPDPDTGVPDCCVPVWDLNPERLMIDTDGALGSTALWVTSSVTLGGLVGPLDFTFGDYKVLPLQPLAASTNLAATPVPSPGTNEFTVGGYNIENFTGSGPQLKKAALNIRTAMQSPDVIGVIEIGSKAALDALAAQVNADTVAAGHPNPQYAAELVPFGTGTQHVGFLIKTSRVLVQRVTQERAGDTFVDPTDGSVDSLHDRPPLVLDAIVDPSGRNPGRILVVVNHLRSFIDVERVDAEGVRVRAKRKAQAEAVAQLLQDLQTANANVPVISVGDYNAYEFSDGYTDPLSVLKGTPRPGNQIVVAGSPDLVNPDFVNLTEGLPAGERYSFIFEGTPQALDHVLINRVAQGYLQRYAVARSNADFPDHQNAGFSTDATRPEANSDHDAPVAYFAFPGTPVVTLNGGATMTVEAFTSFTDPGATAHDDRGALAVTVTGTVNVNVPGSYTLSYSASNGYASTTVTRTVLVVDSVAPSITNYSVTPETFGPPNHEMFDVTATYVATDASGVVACALKVTSNEAANGIADGNTSDDWLVLSPTQVRLRAERAGTGNGRIYTIAVTCTDGSGNASTRTATVSIAK